MIAETLSPKENHGEIFTKPSVVELMLSLAKIAPDKISPSFKILEPSCGSGEFLAAALKRLFTDASFKKAFLCSPLKFRGLFTAFELLPHNVEECKTRLLEILISIGVLDKEGQILVDTWVIEGDFLLTEIEERFDAVVGNPPLRKNRRNRQKTAR